MYLKDEQTSMQQSSHSFMRNSKNSFVYLWQIRRKLFSWYVGEKQVGLDNWEETSQQEKTCAIVTAPQSQLSTQAWSHSRNFTFRKLSLVRSLPYFHFWFASFASSKWSTDIAMVLVYSYLK